MTTDIFQVAVDEGLLQIEPTSNDVLGVLQSVLVRLFERELILEKRLFVILSRQL